MSHRFILKTAATLLALTPLSFAPAHAQQPSPFQYTRDDASPNGLTTVRINAGRVANAPIDKRVFGNFLEHLGGVIYEGVWANALVNPSLEKVEEPEVMPPWWDTAGATSWSERGYLSPRAVRLMPAQGTNPKGTLSQRVFLPIHRTRRYNLSLHLRAPQETGRVLITLRTTNEVDGPVALRYMVVFASNTWDRVKLALNVPASIQKGQPGRLVIEHEGGGAVDVDQVELFPDDAIDGVFDPDVVRMARAWNIPVMRYAGNFSSGYHWRDGVGLRHARPTLRNPAWGGVESNHFGTDEFLRFCELIGAEPQIAANAGNGTPEEARDWVRYVNRGGVQRVKLWEIGNELYGGWQIGHTDAPGNAQRFVRFREAMLDADPNIQIIATGRADEFLPGGMQNSRNWNEAVLRAAQENNGRRPEWLSIHPLVGLPGDIGNLSYAEQFESAMAHPTFLDRTLLPAVEESIRNVQGADAVTRIAPNEWGIIIVGGGRWREGPNHDALSGAVFNALTLNSFMRHSNWVTMANMTALMHGGGIKKPNGVVIVDPQFHTQKLYADAAPRFPLEVQWSGPGRDVPRRGFLPEVANVPDVDIFAALDQNRTRLHTFVVNRSLKKTRPVRLDIAGFSSRQARATILTASDSNLGNTWENPNAVAPHVFTLERNFGRERTILVPPHSLVVLSFDKAGR